MSGTSSNDNPNSSSDNHSGQWNSHYPEPYEYAFARYLARNKAAWDAQHPEAAAPLRPLSPEPEQTYDEGPEFLPGGLHGQPSGLQRYNIPDEAAARTPSPEMFGDFDDRRDESPSPDRNVEASPTYPAPTPSGSSQASPAGFSTLKKRSTRSRPSSSTPQKVKIELQPGFDWNQESLALLCKWKDRIKKGSAVLVVSGAFPGHTVQSIDAVWKNRRAEARQAYQEVYAD